MSTADYSVKNALDDADPNQIADALRKVAIGTLLTPILETIAVSPISATVDLTVKSAAKKAALMVQGVIVTNVGAGAADVGPRLVVPAGGTPAAKGAHNNGVCTISADGKTLTFEGTLAEIIVQWIPVPATALTDKFVAKS